MYKLYDIYTKTLAMGSIFRARLILHAKYEIVTVGAGLHRLINNLLIDIVLTIFCHHLTLKNISRGYAQHKGFNRFN